GVQAASGGYAAADGERAARQAARSEGRILEDRAAEEIGDIQLAVCELQPERDDAGRQGNRFVHLAVAIEDVDDVRLAEIERCHVHAPARIGGDSFRKTWAGLGQRCEADDAVVIGERRRDDAEYEYCKQWKHRAEKTLGHDLLPRSN